MSVDTHVFDLLPAYALECLDADERIQVERHLATCSACQAELRSYTEVAHQLALAAPDAVPSADLKERLMERTRPSRTPRSPSSGAAPAGMSWRQAFAGFMQRSAPVWGVASLLLILALAAGNLWLLQRVNRLEETTRLQTVTLAGTEAAPYATGLIVVSMDGEHGTLVADGLPELSPEQQYQLWLIRDGERDSGALFSVSPDGYGSVWVSSSQPLASYSAFGVSIEPAGGSPGPTGARVLGGSFN